jgi:uncharacterized membrane protein
MADPFPFRYRAREVSRIEAFSDIVFGFALTLIVVSLEVPKTYNELIEAMRGFPAFAICFAILLWIWHAHYTFYRRYALHDEFTLIINSLLLFVVLFYVYPLKFIFGGLFVHQDYTAASARVIFTIYGLGFACIFLLYTLLYAHALKERDQLGLNVIEQHDTRTHVYMFASNVAIGLVSILIAWTAPNHYIGFAGFVYFLIGVMATVIGSMMGSRRRVIEARMARDATTSTSMQTIQPT